MTERIFNIFLYFDKGAATEYGVHYYRVSGGDVEKITFLQDHVTEDHALARRFRLARSFTAGEWLSALRYGDVLHYFEEAFVLLRAPRNPISCITSIVDGTAKVEQQIGPEPFRGEKVSKIEGRGSVPDQTTCYTTLTEINFYSVS